MKVYSSGKASEVFKTPKVSHRLNLRIIFLQIILVFFAVQACSPGKITRTNTPQELPLWTSQMIDSSEVNTFHVTVAYGKMNITGIFVMKYMDGMWKGSLINEFGVKVFDFTSTPEKCKVMNVIALLDKWYIRKTLAGDIQFLLETDHPAFKPSRKTLRSVQDGILAIDYPTKKLIIRRFPDKTLKLENAGRGLSYSFKRIER